MATFEATFESSADFEADFQVEMSGGGDITVEALSVTANGTYTAQIGSAYNPVEVDVEPNLQTLSKTITPSLNTIIRDYTPDSGYDGLAEVFVTVMPIELGTAGTPTASKGSVSNHSVAVTPSVTNTTGYIEGGTKTGTAVTVSASELVSGSETKTANGTYDVTNLAELVVNVSGSTPTGTISITQNGTTDVTNYASANVNVPNSYSASDEGKVVDNGALVSQTSDTVTENGTVDTTLINSLTVNVSNEFPYDEFMEGTTPIGLYWLDSALDINSANIYQNVTGIHITTEGTTLTGIWMKSRCQTLVFEKPTENSNSYNVLSDSTELKIFDVAFSNTTSTSNGWYKNTKSLKKLVYRKSSVMGLGNGATNVFNYTSGQIPPFNSSGTGGTLYCPKSVVANYKTASNWSTTLGYAKNMILPIEGSIYETQYADGITILGAVASDPEYFMEKWNIVSSTNGDIPYIEKSSSSYRAVGIALRGEHTIRLATVDGGESAVYPIAIPTGKTGITITSADVDFTIIEEAYANDEWGQTANSGWLLQSGGNSHSYTFIGTGTTHILIVMRQAGLDEGAVTQAMCNAVTFSWNS